MSDIKKIQEKATPSRESDLEALFGDYNDEPITIVDIPSKGKFYKGFQGVTISPLTFLDEQSILGSKGSKGDIVSNLLEKTIKGVKVEELLSMDKMFLLMKVREVSYGDLYDFTITCPNCDTQIKTSLALSEHLNMNQVSDDLEDPREIMLPKLKVKVHVRFPRSREEYFLNSSEELFKNIYRFVESIDGNEDPIFISKAIKRMHIMDIKKIIAEINKSEYGIDPRFIFDCPECQHSETLAIPLDVTFFSVS